MKWPWQRAEEEPSDVEAAEVERARRRMLTLLDELRDEVERIEWKDAASDRQRRQHPGTA